MAFANVATLVCAYLDRIAPGNVRPEMPPNPPVPFVVVTRVAGSDDGVTDYAVIDVEFFHSNISLAADLAADGHERMRLMKSRGPVPVNGIPVQIDRLVTEDGPHPLAYGDENLRRFVARYRIESRIITIP